MLQLERNEEIKKVFLKFCVAITFFVIFHRKKYVTVTDHIPVDDNPVYITMKKIDLKRNTPALQLMRLSLFQRNYLNFSYCIMPNVYLQCAYML